MKEEDKFIIKVDDDYIVSFDGGDPVGKVSRMGWVLTSTEIGSVKLSQFRSDAKVFEGNINLKSGFEKLYDRVRYGNFKYDHLEIIRCGR